MGIVLIKAANAEMQTWYSPKKLIGKYINHRVKCSVLTLQSLQSLHNVAEVAEVAMNYNNFLTCLKI